MLDDIFATGDTSRSDSLLLGAGRFLSFGAIGVLLGGLFLAAVLVPELLATRRLGHLLIGAAVVAEVGTLLMFVRAGAPDLQGALFFTWGDVIDTQAGRWWLARLLAVGLLALFIPMRAYLGNTPGRVETTLAALVVLGVVAAGGHAVAGSNVVLGFGATIVHLAAMSIWLGGLMLLVLGVPREWFWWAAQFSPWALGSVISARGHRERQRLASARITLRPHRLDLRAMARDQAVARRGRRRHRRVQPQDGPLRRPRRGVEAAVEAEAEPEAEPESEAVALEVAEGSEPVPGRHARAAAHGGVRDRRHGVDPDGDRRTRELATPSIGGDDGVGIGDHEVNGFHANWNSSQP